MFIDDPEVTAAEAVIDNGSFGKRVVRFETGRLAKQAAGSAMAYLDGETPFCPPPPWASTPRTSSTSSP